MIEVGILMGSDTDVPVMRLAGDALDEFHIEWEMRVLSAHRSADATLEYARTAHTRGLKVLIGGAGFAAALPGVLAAASPLPVVGVPLSASALLGIDALLAIAQMPAGVPVATVAVDGARNAGLIAARILAVGDEDRTAAMVGWQDELRRKTLARDAALQDQLRLESGPDG